jgi:hypothetical protein
MTKIGTALRVAADLAEAREALERHDRHVALRRVERDDAWRDEQTELVDALEHAVGRLCRFTRPEATT